MKTEITLSTPADAVVRVEKGHADAEELAALTAVLLARAAANGRVAAEYTEPRSTAGWRRLERQSGFRSAHSWQG
ncbi:acyl-CoA carboxylase epsilon subunit [Streptomyces sp. H10-C2]|uniref:acyl-CoA carboxylase epsilon subunit n=1 Tax=unclassified Streptomyces TaxID=2593676 RepID=UPI0024B8FF64|nr:MULTISPECIES: acyl-CoA carboxylase epsilon subunit [unclassified Streptomyces]MDJ0341663.1 acyl-CoA carboxylase epsilon subunit [Streptomyces sp. PH10-H1]MDJ0369029.1 acyl-CoA carboxylase epsilon subunit [Streptomyces sp. H10-C2]